MMFTFDAIYSYKNPVKSIRLDELKREGRPEQYSKSYILKILENGPTRKFIYVRNTNRITTTEALILGDNTENILERARINGYSTFLALPINSLEVTNGKVSRRKFVGMLGIDAPSPYALKSINPEKLNAIGILIDMLSPTIIKLRNTKERD